MNPRTLLVRMARGIQGTSAYRRLARRMRAKVAIAEASDYDVNIFLALLGHVDPNVPYRSDSLVTNFVARMGAESVGFVQLVRHPPEHAPYVGHWLFSLEVRFKYRGAGIGEELSRTVMNKAAEEGAQDLSLLVFEDNRPAVRLYTKLGFMRVVLPDLEKILEREATESGRRRIALRRPLEGTSECRMQDAESKSQREVLHSALCILHSNTCRGAN